jgi:hypothetical protein
MGHDSGEGWCGSREGVLGQKKDDMSQEHRKGLVLRQWRDGMGLVEGWYGP